jgi:hypothetical protein
VRTGLGAAFQAVYLLILVGAAAGLAAQSGAWRRREPGPLLLLAFTVAGLVVPIAFFGDPRFKVAMVPCLALLAACGLDAALALRRRGHRAERVDDAAAPTIATEAVDG